MRNKLLITTAMAALIGCTTLAVAQETKEAPGKTTTSPQAAPHPGGAMSQPGGAMKPSGGAAQNTPPKGPSEAQQGQAQERSGQGASEKGASENRGVSQSEQSNPNSAVNRRGAQEEHGTQERGAQSQEQRGAQSQEQRGAQSNQPNKATSTQQPSGQSQQNAQGAAPNKAGGGASVQLSQTQRTQIKDIVVKDRNVARVDHVDFSVSVGVTVPRTVHVAVLPAEVVTIVPEYRGFDYIIVGDQLLIIDPNTMEVVAILPA